MVVFGFAQQLKTLDHRCRWGLMNLYEARYRARPSAGKWCKQQDAGVGGRCLFDGELQSKRSFGR